MALAILPWALFIAVVLTALIMLGAKEREFHEKYGDKDFHLSHKCVIFLVGGFIVGIALTALLQHYYNIWIAS